MYNNQALVAFGVLATAVSGYIGMTSGGESPSLPAATPGPPERSPRSAPRSGYNSGNRLRRAEGSSGAPKREQQQQQQQHQVVQVDSRARLKKVADAALRAIKNKRIVYRGETFELGPFLTEMERDTKVYAEDSILKEWKNARDGNAGGMGTAAHLSVLNITTLEAARILHNAQRFQQPGGGKIGVLNFASATKPGGGFRNGAEAQEESIARASTLSHSLDSRKAGEFYRVHRREEGMADASFYTHSMIWSPGVTVFLDDDAREVEPYQIEVISCAAVNAKEVIAHDGRGQVEGARKRVQIEKVMLERMGRILRLFEQEGIRDIVLGTFGTGVFQNEISVVARHWAALLLEDDARYKHSFDRVIFAITGSSTFSEFHNSFEGWAASHQTQVPARRWRR